MISRPLKGLDSLRHLEISTYACTPVFGWLEARAQHKVLGCLVVQILEVYMIKAEMRLRSKQYSPRFEQNHCDETQQPYHRYSISD